MADGSRSRMSIPNEGIFFNQLNINNYLIELPNDYDDEYSILIYLLINNQLCNIQAMYNVDTVVDIGDITYLGINIMRFEQLSEDGCHYINKYFTLINNDEDELESIDYMIEESLYDSYFISVQDGKLFATQYKNNKSFVNIANFVIHDYDEKRKLLDDLMETTILPKYMIEGYNYLKNAEKKFMTKYSGENTKMFASPEIKENYRRKWNIVKYRYVVNKNRKLLG
jgi:hypothetical protein